MDLSPFAAQGGQSHFRGENVDFFVTSFPPRKLGQSPVNCANHDRSLRCQLAGDLAGQHVKLLGAKLPPGTEEPVTAADVGASAQDEAM